MVTGAHNAHIGRVAAPRQVATQHDVAPYEPSAKPEPIGRGTASRHGFISLRPNAVATLYDSATMDVIHHYTRGLTWQF